MIDHRTIGEIREQYKDYTLTELEELREHHRTLAHQARERFEVVREYERINALIDKRFTERYGDFPHAYGGRYGDLYLQDNFSEWKGTFYDKERLFIEECLTQKVHSLAQIPFLLEGRSSIPELDELCLPIKASIMGFCDYVKGSKSGPILHLIDPDGEYTTPPFLGMPAYMSNIYVGKICVVSIKFQRGRIPEVLEVATLPFTLRERITEGSPLEDTLTEPPYLEEEESADSDS